MTTIKEEILNEFFGVISTPKDTDVLGNIEVWVYNSDREKYPPHCHVRTSDGKIEFEVSILNWEPFHLKSPTNKNINGRDEINSDIKKKFFTWLNRNSKEQGYENFSNKKAIWINWNQNNPNNRLEQWSNKKENIDKDLIDFLNPKLDFKQLVKTIIGELSVIYSTDKSQRHELHKLSPQELLDRLDINVEINGDEELVNLIKRTEKQVYLWTEN